ncbi:MAG TPA: hypothetical protein VFL14_14920 [Xanthomonadales bacterium]|nr:hypothetical protein [Xanthomonadales bacterium]
MSEFELRRRLRELPREREPRVDLWPGIAARLGAQPAVAAPAARPRPARYLAMAAALVLAATGGWLGVALRGEGQAPASSVATRDASAWPVAQADAMEESYRGAFTASFGGQRQVALARYVASPDVLAAERELDAAQRQLEIALRVDPDSVYLLDLLRQTHAQRARLYRPALAMG